MRNMKRPLPIGVMQRGGAFLEILPPPGAAGEQHKLCECGHEPSHHTKPMMLGDRVYNGCASIGCGCPAYSASRNGWREAALSRRQAPPKAGRRLSAPNRDSSPLSQNPPQNLAVASVEAKSASHLSQIQMIYGQPQGETR